MSSICDEKYLCAIIRKPQEGKTFICLENIKTNGGCYHIIITMNTIKSNLQFFQRAKDKFGDKICVFNSKGKKKDQSSDFKHARDVSGVKKHLRGGVEVIIMCAHPKRFEASILDLLDEIDDSKNIRKSVFIHIDEAHAYVPPFRDRVVEMNENDVTKRIYMYSATPFSIWTNEASVRKTEQLFKNIYIVDSYKEFKIIKSTDYFGVKDCDHFIIPPSENKIDEIIPNIYIERYGNDKQKSNIQAGNNEYWGQPGVFDIGNEVQLLTHVNETLMKLKSDKSIEDNKFTYNFIPGFCRKLTHYAIMEYILEIYPSALVLIINGDGTLLYKNEETEQGNLLMGDKIPNMNEPSEQIQYCIEKYPNRPTFITGFHCVGMSVTFINEKIGNFDHVIYSHEHYTDRPDIQYQLCRFLFNYIKWDETTRENIKKTKLYVTSHNIIKNCLDYESQIDKIDISMSGSLRTKKEVVGDMNIKEKKVPKERMYDELEFYTECPPIKRITVDDEDEEEEKLNKVKRIYYEWTGKELSGKSMPKKNDNGFYECSTTGPKDVQENPKEIKRILDNWKNTAGWQLKSNIYKYARVYVAYDDKKDNTSYAWIIRRMEIKMCEKVTKFWESIEDKK